MLALLDDWRFEKRIKKVYCCPSVYQRPQTVFGVSECKKSRFNNVIDSHAPQELIQTTFEAFDVEPRPPCSEVNVSTKRVCVYV